MIRENSNRIEGDALSGGAIFLRVLAFVFLPIAAAALVVIVMGLISSWGTTKEIFYMLTESILFGAFLFMIAVMISLVVKWTMSTKIALKFFYIAIIGLFAFIGAAAITETINTKPIVTAANSFKELPGLNREVGTNGDKFSPAPGFVPCINFMGFGCPNVTRTWNLPPGRELSINDLQKVLDDSGWKDVKIQQDQCNMRDLSYKDITPDCSAEGMVGDYKATVRILKLHDNWELRMYLRLPTNSR